MNSLLQLLLSVINIYIFCIFAQVILSWLVAFNVINTSNQFVYSVGNFLYQITEPAYRRVRQIIPTLGGLDLSPLIVLLLLYFVQNLMIEYWPR